VRSEVLRFRHHQLHLAPAGPVPTERRIGHDIRPTCPAPILAKPAAFAGQPIGHPPKKTLRPTSARISSDQSSPPLRAYSCSATLSSPAPVQMASIRNIFLSQFSFLAPQHPAASLRIPRFLAFPEHVRNEIPGSIWHIALVRRKSVFYRSVSFTKVADAIGHRSAVARRVASVGVSHARTRPAIRSRSEGKLPFCQGIRTIAEHSSFASHFHELSAL
jgi:hypothetical protein